jgi:hypothetical protein
MQPVWYLVYGSENNSSLKHLITGTATVHADVIKNATFYMAKVESPMTSSSTAAGSLMERYFELAVMECEQAEQRGVEHTGTHPVIPLEENLNSFIMGQSSLVGPFTAQRIVNIAQPYHGNRPLKAQGRFFCRGG